MFLRHPQINRIKNTSTSDTLSAFISLRRGWVFGGGGCDRGGCSVVVVMVLTGVGVLWWWWLRRWQMRAEREREIEGGEIDQCVCCVCCVCEKGFCRSKKTKPSSPCRLQTFGLPLLLQMPVDVVRRLQTFSRRKNKQHLSC
ncbi:hypothetical protein HanRHA438_Chr12g0571601 [Helianthus annuus]|nr:hypothetical protein HanRHA438_Chr12g0571601 [Helianthus annuus]